MLTFTGPRDPLTNYLNSRREVLNWFAILPAAILVVSRMNATDLKNIIHAGFPNLWFMISEIDPAKINGWMNKPAWDFINNPKSSGRWEP
jgi:hypothetical protein